MIPVSCRSEERHGEQLKVLLKIRYIGTAYCGFQCQKNGVAVQNVLTDAAKKVYGTPCLVTGCSRTDAGVHALDFCCTVESADGQAANIPVGRIHRAFNSVLPPDIRVIGAASVDGDFHPRYGCKGKNYIYRIWDAPWEDPFESGRSMRCIFRVTDEKLARMQKAAEQFIGTHDFSAFMAKGSKITDTVRTVTLAKVVRDGGAVVFSVSADGFLYNMVRIMAGTLLDVAAGRTEPESISDIILSGDRSRAGQTAAACGLYLNEVYYDSPLQWQCD